MNILPEKDAIGQAIADYAETPNPDARITVYSPDFDDDYLPVSYLFRAFEDMPLIEQKALKLARGHVLDVGAGAGCHTRYLQQNGLPVTAVESSPLASAYLRKTFDIPVHNVSIYDFEAATRYDTILLLMNGLGIAGKITGVEKLIRQLTGLLTENGQILIDSSDLSYLSGDEIPTTITYRMQYRSYTTDWFDWLYLSYENLSFLIQMMGYKIEKVAEGSHYDYLAKITL